MVLLEDLAEPNPFLLRIVDAVETKLTHIELDKCGGGINFHVDVSIAAQEPFLLHLFSTLIGKPSQWNVPLVSERVMLFLVLVALVRVNEVPLLMEPVMRWINACGLKVKTVKDNATTAFHL